MSALNLKQTCLSLLDKLSELEAICVLPGATAELKHFRGRLEDNEFRIAIVGEYSSGKSTFVNALLGKDVLSHATTETTATITRIMNVPRDDSRCFTGVVQCADGTQIELDDFGTLREYTTRGSRQFDVVHEISSVELYLPILNSSNAIVLIDTPGLNGIAQGHRERTVELIQQAHSCIYLLQLRGLSESDVSFVRQLSHYQHNFIFVQNFIDELRRTEGETLHAKLDEQRAILSETVFANNPDVNYEICGVSALMALTYADESIPSLYEGSPLLTPEERSRLYERSNFQAFQSLLDDTFRADRACARILADRPACTGKRRSRSQLA